MGSSSSNAGNFVKDAASFISGGVIPGGNKSGSKQAVAPGRDQQDARQKEVLRANILADERFDESTREQLLNGLQTLDPTAFNQLYTKEAANNDAVNAILADRRKAEAGRKQLLGQPGLRRQTSVLAGVQKQNEAEIAAKRSEKYSGESKKSALLGMSTPRG